MIVLGVDAGALGAIAAYDASTGQLLMIEDMPADLVELGGKQRHRVSPQRLAALLRPFDARLARIQVRMVMEQPTYRPMVARNRATGMRETRQPGAAGMAQLGESVGMLKGIAAALDMPFMGVAPGAWKRVVRCSAEKGEARRRASECSRPGRPISRGSRMTAGPRPR